MNNVVLVGRLSKDPEIKHIPETGLAVCTITLAVDKGLSREQKIEATANGKFTADFVSISVFGKQAENCEQYMSKGRECAIYGKITTNKFTTKEGKKRSVMELTAQRIEYLGTNAKEKSSNKKTKLNDNSIPDNVEEML